MEDKPKPNTDNSEDNSVNTDSVELQLEPRDPAPQKPDHPQ